MELPAELQDLISAEIGWEYNPRQDEARCRKNMTASEYMGTYFPRSFSESYQIFELLLKNICINQTIINKKEINILDLGSGTGGNMLGFLWLLKEKGLFNNNRNVSIYLRSVDGDGEGLRIQEKLIEHFFGDYVAGDYVHRVFSSSAEIVSFLNKHLKEQGQVFDIMMASKFINEFYSCQKDYRLNKGLYGRIVRLAENYLTSDGMVIMTDITSRSFDPDGAWLPEIMSEEICNTLNDPECTMSHIQPISCAFFQYKCIEAHKCYPQICYEVKYNMPHFGNICSSSRICFRILAKNEYSKQVLSSERVKDGYIIAEKQDGNINTCFSGENFASCCINASGPNLKLLPKAYDWSLI